MLTRLNIENFAIIDSQELELGPGLTVISGASGAGKSIIVDALGLALGARGEGSCAKNPEKRVDISLEVDLEARPEIADWLRERDLGDADGLCALRRLIDPKGRSRAYVNGAPVPLRDLQALGERLVAIHGQHDHYALLRADTPRRLLDSFADGDEAAQAVAQCARQWRELRERLQADGDDAARESRAQLLRFQVEELDGLAPTAERIDALERDQRRGAAAEEIRAARAQALALCDGDDSVENSLNEALSTLEAAAAKDADLEAARELLASAREALRESARELRRHEEDAEVSGGDLAEIEAQLGALYQMARKHKINLDALPARHLELRAELETLERGTQGREETHRELAAAHQRYRELAATLGAQRAAAGEAFAEEINRQLAQLDMGHCDFRVELRAREADEPHPHGAEQVDFAIRANPGQPYGSLKQIASGGELSRLSLALRVVGGHRQLPPCLVFDEVDTGIGSAAAERVGALLRELGEGCQTLCVTHMAPIACYAERHFVATKTLEATSVSSRLRPLASKSERVEEIARLLAGSGVTRNSLAHAEEMLRQRSDA